MASAERFGYQWNKFPKIIPEYELQFLKWVYPLNKKSFKNKIVLDAGCGIGRNSYWILKYGAKYVVAFDYDKRTVKVAKKNLKKFSNAEVTYNSIMDIGYKNEFDIAISIGVIDHLETPKEAVQNLVKSVKKGGIMLVWVVAYEGNEFVAKYSKYIRRITSKIPSSFTNFVSYFFSIPLFLAVNIFPQKHPYLKQLSLFKFWHIQSIVFVL